MSYFKKIGGNVLTHILNALSDIKKLNYHDVIVNKENEHFINYLKDRDLAPNLLDVNLLQKNWYSCFQQNLNEEQARKKLKYFTYKHLNVKISFVDELPPINTHISTILISKTTQNMFQDFWSMYKDMLLSSNIAPDRLAKNDFDLTKQSTYEDILENISKFDESNKKHARQKKIYYLFFLYLASQKAALLPTGYIMPKDTFLSYASSLRVLTFFQENHFFYTMPKNKHQIEKELAVNNKAKYINYMRFSYLVNSDNSLLEKVQNNDMSRIMSNLRISSNSTKMVDVYENPLRRCLFWHGAQNVHLTKKESNKENLTPLQILYQLDDIDPKYIHIFYPYFSSRPSNSEEQKYARHIKKFILFLSQAIPKLDRSSLQDFFATTLIEDADTKEIKLDSKFLRYLYQHISAKTMQQDIQMIVFQAIENDQEFAGCFPRTNLETIYKMPKGRKIAKLALDHKIVQKMKEICLLRPIKDDYYTSTFLDKSQYTWPHFHKTEPQLPVMLFIHLSLPWRKEHSISMDRDNFFKKDHSNHIIEVQVTTDKNQENNFYIEREYFEYAISFTDNNGQEYDTLAIIDDMIRYAKDSFPDLKALYRKGNTTWGKIKPILCKNTGKGFIPSGVFDGYYYKTLLKALEELNYTPEQIPYFIQISNDGKKKISNYSEIYSSVETLTLQQVSTCLNSEYFSPHSIRKYNITYLVSNKKSLEFILKLSGHRALSTVLQIYIDYDMLARLNVSENIKTAITDNFRNLSKLDSHQIIENYKKYNSLNIKEIKEKLSKENLFFSPYILEKNGMLKPNDEDDLEILIPVFWEGLAMGICTNAYDCEAGKNHACSVCPFFLTGITFVDRINAKIMELSSKILEHYKIINKHLEDENLSGKEAILYEEKVQLNLAELEGYAAIINKINNIVYSQLEVTTSSDEKHNLPVRHDFSLIKYQHIPHLAAQLEIYKYSQKHLDHNLEIEHSVEILYTKIMELIILGEIPSEPFMHSINYKEKSIDIFLELVKDDHNNLLETTLLNQTLP